MKINDIYSGLLFGSSSSGGGGAGTYYFHVEYDGDNYSTEQTIADLEAAYAAGNQIMLEFYDDYEGFTTQGFMSREEYDGEIYYTAEAYKYSWADEILFIIGVNFSTESGLDGSEVKSPIPSIYTVNMLWNEETEKSYLDKTAAEITEAMKTRPVIVVDIGEDYALSWSMISGWAYTNDYTFRILYEDQVMKFTATTADAYPIEE